MMPRRVAPGRELMPLAVGLACLGAPALAGSWTPPEGCTGYLTVQSKGCRVSNHYTCEKDPAGHKWRADFDQEGIYFVSRIDAETQWIESYDLFPTVRQTLDPNPADPASFSDLLSKGMDRFDFHQSSDDGARRRITGFDRLTGRSVTIDGIALEETEFDFTETDASGQVLNRARGKEYISREWRMFLAGPSEWDGGTGFVPYDGSPIQFILPGEQGFFSSEPIFDCDATLSMDAPDAAIVPATVRP